MPRKISSTMGKVDPAFIQSLKHRPKLEKIEAEGIQVIDLSVLSPADDHIRADDYQVDGLVSEIDDACKNWGFFQVINHVVSINSHRKIEEVARKFFDQPLKVRRNEVSVVGYYEAENTKNVRDWKDVFDFGLENPTLVLASVDPDKNEVTQWFNQWPDSPPQLRTVCEGYAKEVENLAYKLLELIALSLGLPADRLNGFFLKDQTTFNRLNHYPPCPAPDLTLGVGRHKDGIGLTILAQDDVGGLEVKRKTDGEWVRVKHTPDAYIINVGDIIQVWSNERYKSVEHRVVVNSEKERFSVPFFFSPAHYTMVKPLEELTSKENPAKYRQYNWGKFLVNRKGINFKKRNVANIQIADFRIPDLADELDGGLSIS